MRHATASTSGSPARRVRLALVTVIALLIPVVFFALKPGTDGTPDPGLTEYQQALQAEVQYGDGSPKTGRDPASQGQTSLADAAGSPNQGPGARTDKPATGKKGGKGIKVDPEKYLGKNGANIGGCIAGYGEVGQCLPVVPKGTSLTCAVVVETFADGVAVVKKDRLGLDTNKDGIACGAGDAGVPADPHSGH